MGDGKSVVGAYASVVVFVHAVLLSYYNGVKAKGGFLKSRLYKSGFVFSCHPCAVLLFTFELIILYNGVRYLSTGFVIIFDKNFFNLKCTNVTL